MKNYKLYQNIIIIIVLILIYYYTFSDNFEHFVNYKLCKTKKVNNALQFILNETNSQEIGYKDDWELYLPCNYTTIESELSELNLKKNQSVFGISGSDSIASKNNLWKILKNYYGYSIANDIHPNSFIPKDEIDIDRFNKNFKSKKIIF